MLRSLETLATLVRMTVGDCEVGMSDTSRMNHKPPIAFMIGYGDNEKEVQVTGLGEIVGAWATGRWVRTNRCVKLGVGDRVMALADVVDAIERMRTIPKRSICCRIV